MNPARSMRGKLLRALPPLGCALLVMLAGCPATPQATTCVTNRDCGASDVCIAGRCVPPPAIDGGTRLDVGTVDPRQDAWSLPAPDAARPDAGCVGCADGLQCTLDACDPATLACTHPPIDADGDGHPAQRVGTEACSLGTDCDDSNGNVHPGAVEICDDRIDEDCNGILDDGCGTPPENCATARALLLAPEATSSALVGSVLGTTLGLRGDYTTSCNGAMRSGGDVVYYFDVEAASDVVIDTFGSDYDTLLAVSLGACGDASFGSMCNDDADIGVSGVSRLFLHRLTALGTMTMTRVYVLVDGFDGGEGNFRLTVTANTATEDDCRGSLDITGGGTVIGTMGPPTFATAGSCQSAGESAELQAIFQLTSPADSILDRLTASSTAFFPDLYVRDALCDGAESACVHGSAASTSLFDVPSPSGTSHVIVDGAVTGQPYLLQYDP